ncbi:MAG: leucine-rich repeat domain-containing protein, partial [Anaeroplasmataceae bacterium]|nr:leucine-rich repeat domain-containing protein [Anaeroplasmataceae bacterium]
LITTHDGYLRYTQSLDDSYSTDIKGKMSSQTVSIEQSAFENCVSINNFDFTYILHTGDRAFFNSGLTHVEVPDTIISLGEELFASSKKLEKADILKEELSVRIFMDCILLDNMNIIEGTTVIPEQAFKNCESLTNLILPYSLREFHLECFMNTNIPEVTINPYVNVIQARVFSDCDNLKKAIIYPNFLGMGMFEGADALQTVWLYNQIEEIADRAFMDCISLETVSFMDKRPDFTISDSDRPYENDATWTWWVKNPQGINVDTHVSTIRDLGLTYEIKNGNWYIGGKDTGISASQLSGVPTKGSDFYYHVGSLKTNVLTIKEIEDQTYEIDETTRNWFINGVDSGISAYQQKTGNITKGSDFYYYIDGVKTNVMHIVPSTVTPVKGDDGNWYIDGVNTNVAYRKLNDPSTLYGNEIKYYITNGNRYVVNDTTSIVWEKFLETKNDSSVVYHFQLKVNGTVVDDKVVSQAEYNASSYPTIDQKTYWVVYGVPTEFEKVSGDVWTESNGHLALNGVETDITPSYTTLNNTPVLNTTDYYWYIGGQKVLKGYTDKDAPVRSITGWNWAIDGVDTGIDAYATTGVTPSLKSIKSGQNVTEDDLYWYIGNQKTSIIGYEEDTSSYNINKDENGNYFWYIGDEKTVQIEVPHVDDADKYWYVGDTKTSIWSVERTNAVTSIGKDNCWYIGATNTKISCIKYFEPTVSSDFIYKTSTSTTALPTSLKRIGVSSFENNKTIRRVVLNGIEIIDDRAFYGCTLLEAVEIPSSLQEAGSEIFMDCTNLVDVTIDSNNLGEYMFAGCTSVETVVFKEGLVRTPTGIFKGATSLNDVTLPSTLKIVGESSFEECAGLKTIVFPAGLTTLEDYAFRSSGMETVVITKNITTIGTEVFAHCKNLKDIIFENKTLGDSMLLDCTGLVNLALPEGITTIDPLAFADCIKLETVILPTTLKTIGYAAFRGDYRLQVMNLPFIGESAGTTTGEEALFGWIFGVPEAQDEEDPVEVAKAEEQKENMKETIQYAYIDGAKTEVTYYIPTTLTKLVVYGEYAIGYGAFSNCSDIVALVIKDNGIVAIGDYAFFGCENLTYLIDKGDEYPVHNDDGSVTHSINKSTDYATYVADNTDGYTINIFENVESIGNYAFAGCSTITSVKIIIDEDNNSALTTIGNYAFADCTALERINEGELMKYNFPYDTPGDTSEDKYILKLFNYLLPETVTSIGDFAFKNNGGVKAIYVSDSATYMGECMLAGTAQLEMLSIPYLGKVNSPTTFSSGRAADRNTTLSILFGTESFTGGSGVEQCGVTVYIPNSLETLYVTHLNSVEKNALRNTRMIRYLEIADTCQYIELASMALMSNLTMLKMPFVGRARGNNGTTYDNNQTGVDNTMGYLFGSETSGSWFWNKCSKEWYYDNHRYYYTPASLKKVELTQETFIDSQAFYAMSNLTTVIFNEGITQIGNSWNVDGPSNRWHSEGYGAFEGCSKLTNVILPQSLTYIGKRAFYGCTSLKEIVIPSKVTTILIYAFLNCTGLKYVRMENKIFGVRMFQGCSGLVDVETVEEFDLIPEYCFYG